MGVELALPASSYFRSWNPPRNTGPLVFSVVPECSDFGCSAMSDVLVEARSVFLLHVNYVVLPGCSQTKVAAVPAQRVCPWSALGGF